MLSTTLYHANCVDQLRDCPPNSIDLLITDPPYRITARGNAGNAGGMMQSKLSMQGSVFELNNIDCEVYAPEFYRVLKDGSHCYIMTNHINLQHILNVFTQAGFHFIKSLIWDKGNKIMGQYYMSSFEYILFFRKGRGRKINHCGTADILRVPNKKTKGPDGKNLHDTEKPVELMKILVENSSQEGDVVLDPFMGIGSTGLACVETGRNFVGIELDRRYFEIAKERIEGA